MAWGVCPRTVPSTDTRREDTATASGHSLRIVGRVRFDRRSRRSLLVAGLSLGVAACASDEPSAVGDAGTVATTESPTPTGASTVVATTDDDPAGDDPAGGDPDDSRPDNSEPTEPTEPTQQTQPGSPTDPTDPPPEGSTAVPGPIPPSSTTPLYSAGDIDQGLQPFFEQAIDDLAARLEVVTSEITVHAGVLVVWPDTSLGCPQPGMSYAQVLTDGSVIELEHDGRYFRYHTGGERGPFVCEQLLVKAPPGEQLDAGDGIDS